MLELELSIELRESNKETINKLSDLFRGLSHPGMWPSACFDYRTKTYTTKIIFTKDDCDNFIEEIDKLDNIKRFHVDSYHNITKSLLYMS